MLEELILAVGVLTLGRRTRRLGRDQTLIDVLAILGLGDDGVGWVVAKKVSEQPGLDPTFIKELGDIALQKAKEEAIEGEANYGQMR